MTYTVVQHTEYIKSLELPFLMVFILIKVVQNQAKRFTKPLELKVAKALDEKYSCLNLRVGKL